jgi:hypothetical protein
VNRTVSEALRSLGYVQAQIENIVRHVETYDTIVDYIFRWLGLTFIAGYQGADLAAGPVSGLRHARHRAATRQVESALAAAGSAEIESDGHETEANATGVRDDCRHGQLVSDAGELFTIVKGVKRAMAGENSREFAEKGNELYAKA